MNNEQVHHRNSFESKLGARRLSKFLDRKSVALVLSLAFTLGMIHTYIFPLGAFLFSGWSGNDCYQMAWNLWFANESITHGRSPYATNLINYPLGANLSHHTLAAGFFPVTFLIKIITRGDPMYPIYAYKLVILLSFTLILYFSYLLLRQLSLPRGASAAAAAAYAFCDFYLLHAQHLNHLAGFFLPLTALFMVRSYQRPAWANVLMLAIVSACSIYFTEFALYIYLGAILFVLVTFLFKAERQQLLAKLRQAGAGKLITAAAIFLLILAPFVMNLVRDHVILPSYADSSAFSANLAGFFIPAPHTTPLYRGIFAGLNAKVTTGVGGYEVFIGFPLMFFAVVGLIKTSNSLIRASAIVALIFLVLSLGPTLKFLGWDTGLPLPYSLLMRLPPFDLGRTPVRFIVAGLFLFAIVSAFGIAEMQRETTRRWGPRKSSLVMLLVFGWITAEAYSPIAKQQPFARPHGLEKLVAGPVLNLPPYSPDGYSALLQVFHHQPIGTGYLARKNQAELEHVRRLQEASDLGMRTLCDRAKEMGFRNIVINPTDVVWPTERRGSVPDASECSINVVDLRDSGVEQPENFPPYVVGTRIDVANREAEKYLWYGWSGLEPEFRWTEKSRAAIVFALSEVKPAILRIQMGAFLVPGRLDEQRVNIALNGHEIATLNIRQVESREYSIALPVEFLHEHNVVSFDLPNADSPVTFGLSNDDRFLGINVQWIEIDPWVQTRPPS